MRVSKATKMGSYICRIGTYDVRQKTVMPKTVRGHAGTKNTKGSTEGRIYRGKNLVKGNFTDAFAAIKKAYSMVCKEGNQDNVSKKIVTRYNLSC